MEAYVIVVVNFFHNHRFIQRAVHLAHQNFQKKSERTANVLHELIQVLLMACLAFSPFFYA